MNRWIARERLTGTILIGTYDQLREFDKRIWHIEPIIKSIRKEKHNLLMIKQGKASKAIYLVVRQGNMVYPVSKSFVNMVLDCLAMDKARSVTNHNNYMTYKRIEYGI